MQRSENIVCGPDDERLENVELVFFRHPCVLCGCNGQIRRPDSPGSPRCSLFNGWRSRRGWCH